MPSSKRQKTSRKTSASTREEHHDSDSSGRHKNDSNTKKRDPETIPPHEYVCISIPLFEYKKENFKRPRNKRLSDHEVYEKYQANFEDETANKTVLQPASQHQEWKWIIQWEGWKLLCDYTRRAKYCDPDLFDMYIYNDWKYWGLTELIENLVTEFDTQWKKKGDNRSLHKIWAVISALGHWLIMQDMEYTMSDDGARVGTLTRLVGYALLTALSAIEQAGELNAQSALKDLPLVISLYLETVQDLPQYGIEGNDVAWASHAVDYFKKAKLDAKKGICGTAELLKQCKELTEEDEEDEEDELLDAAPIKTSKSDPWGWASRLKKYKKSYGPKIGGTHHDITKFSRAERAAHAFDGKDPLADVPLNALKDGLLDFN